MVDTNLTYEMLLDQLYEGVCFVDHDNIVTFWNRGAERITGFTKEEMVGNALTNSRLLHCDREGNSLFNGKMPVQLSIESCEPMERELYLQHKEGRRVPVVLRVSPVLNGVGEAIGGLEVFSDNTSTLTARERIEELEEMALICPLTGAGNRRYSQMALDNAMEELKRYGWQFGLLFIDIDHFKNINDTYGHAVGDEVLQMVVQALRTTLRTFDFIGRWGGEEFMLLLPNVTGEVLNSVAERCRQGVQESLLTHEGREIRVTVSIGAILPTPEESVVNALERADRLMYFSKASGRNRVTTDG